MLDIRLIREKPDFVRQRLETRDGGEEAKVDGVLRIDAERRKSETELQRLQSERNRLSKEIGARRSRKEASEELEAKVRRADCRSGAARERVRRIAAQFASGNSKPAACKRARWKGSQRKSGRPQLGRETAGGESGRSPCARNTT